MRIPAPLLSSGLLALLVSAPASADADSAIDSAVDSAAADPAESTRASDAAPASSDVEAGDEGQADVALADGQSEEQAAGSGSGDADAGGPVKAPAAVEDDNDKKVDGDQKKKDEKSAGAVEEELKPEAKKKDKDEEKEESVPAALQAGGVVGGGSSFPLSLTTSFNASLGTGTFAPGYTNNPSFITALTLRPAWTVPKLFDYQPAMIVSGGITADIEWFSSFTGSAFYGPRDRQLRISDGTVSLILPGLVTIPFVDIGITPILVARLPLSVASRFSQRILGGTAAAQATWTYSSFLGTMGVQGTGVGTYWEHLATERKVPCGESYPTGGTFFGGTGLDDGVSTLPLTVGRLEERTEDGQCILAGRQIIGSASASLASFWSLPELFGTHTLSASGGLIYSVFRPLAPNEATRSQYAQPQSLVNVAPWHSFTLSYNYAVPGDWIPFAGSAQLTGGVTSTQPFYDNTGAIRMPFDFNIQGGNNFTQFFTTLTVGI